MIIRPATVDDFEEIFALSRSLSDMHIKSRPDIFKAAPEQTKKEFKNALKKNEYFITVIEDGGKIIGFAKWMLYVTKNNEVLFDLTSAMIYELIISDDCRHKGLGKKLFDKVVEFAKEKGANVIELDVWSFNENARKFYDSLGMTTQRTRLEKKI